MAKIIPPQDIPSELYDQFRAIGGVARPNDVAQRRYPWSIVQPGTSLQLDVWDKFLYCTRCFGDQSQAMREWWYLQSIPSGLFYYTYFMGQTLPIVHQGLRPAWCLEVCYEANELPPDATPSWSAFGDGSNCSVSKGILTLRNVAPGACSWVRYGVVPPLDVPGVSIRIEAKVKGIHMPWPQGYHQLQLTASNYKSGFFTLYNDRIWFNGVYIDRDTTDAFHIYRMDFNGVDVDLIIDGNKIMTRPLILVFESNRALFGIRNTISPYSEALWDYVCWYFDEE